MKPIIDSRSGTVIGFTSRVRDSRLEIRSRNNSLLGYFNPKHGPEGCTFNASGTPIGHGDQRLRLLPKE